MSCVNIVKRSEWGARKPKSAYENINGAAEYVIIIHTATPTSTGEAAKERVRQIQKYHMDTRGWSDIGYSFLIGIDGTIYEGRGWGVVGAHTRGYNDKSCGIAFIGNFNNDTPSPATLKSAQILITSGVSQKYLREDYKLVGHRDLQDTQSPGNKLYSVIQEWPHYGK
ncbi:unnamed protein product [Calicophoron daubneyi]|uniref:Peptidoglycan-recognition protein n=1 Tax=Calicophoron daubneyi TaxID=300641 RepID=A0AAV2TX09_CALDB